MLSQLYWIVFLTPLAGCGHCGLKPRAMLRTAGRAGTAPTPVTGLIAGSLNTLALSMHR